MTSSDVDINLLHLKLNALEERVKVLEGKKDMIIERNISLGDLQSLPPNCTDYVFIKKQPVQWPNESFTDYLKRIGEYNEAQGENK